MVVTAEISMVIALFVDLIFVDSLVTGFTAVMSELKRSLTNGRNAKYLAQGTQAIRKGAG